MTYRFFAVAALSATAVFAQNVAGTWQGTLQTPQRALRLVMKVTRAQDESLKALFYAIDQSGQGIPASTVTFQGGMLKAVIPAIGGSYEGKLSADGATLTGTFTQGQPLPLILAKATPSTEWAIPDAPPPPKTMAPDAKPTFEVASIKPSDPASQGMAINVGRGGGNTFTTQNTPLSELIKFAYGLHERQVMGGPSWVDTDKYDIVAKPDTAGVPNVAQLRSMVRQLLEDRFALTYHREKKELSAFVITVDKGGVKMTKVEGNRGNLPGFGGRGPGSFGVQNSTMSEFAEFLQARVMDRPVVDQSGLTDRYDFTLEFRPDESQRQPNAPAFPQEIEDRPDLMTAMKQQLGLKIEAGKTPVDVMMIDKVSKPSAN